MKGPYDNRIAFRTDSKFLLVFKDDEHAQNGVSKKLENGVLKKEKRKREDVRTYFLILERKLEIIV